MGTWVTDTKVEYLLSEFPNDKFNLDALQYEIQHSAITVAINLTAGLSGTAAGGCAINFNGLLGSSDRTLLDNVIAAHQGTPLPTEKYDSTGALLTAATISNKDSKGNVIVAVQPRVGTGATLITHNFADPKSWYANATRVADAILPVKTVLSIPDYTTYNFNEELIDLQNGRVTFEDRIVNKAQNNETYIPKIKVNDVLVTSGYSINYITNQVIFDNALTGGDVVKATFYKVNDSTFFIKPDTGKRLIIEHVEVQFSKNIDFTSKQLWFDIYAFNPADPGGPKIRAQAAAIYKNVKDFINECNNAECVVVPQIGELTKECYIFVWKYPVSRILKSTLGIEIRLFVYDPVTGSKSIPHSSKDGAPVDVATATFYCLSETDV